MCPFAAHIGSGENQVARQFALDAEIPLLHVRPHGLGGNRSEGLRKEQTSSGANAGIICDVVLRGNEDERRGTLERLGIAFVAVGVLEEYSVSTSDGHLAVALRIECETDAGSRIKQMAFHAA